MPCLAANGYASLFVSVDGTVFCCGFNQYYKLSTPNSDILVISQLLIDAKILAVASGTNHTLLLDVNGCIWSAGQNEEMQLGRVGDLPTFETIPNLPSIRSVHARAHLSIFIAHNGTAWICGKNEYCKMGFPMVDELIPPTPVPNLPAVKWAAAGANHTLFLDVDGVVWACGRNNRGQLGFGDVNDRTSVQPVPNPSGTQITAISAGEEFSLILDKFGVVYSCGDNLVGQLGRVCENRDAAWKKVKKLRRPIHFMDCGNFHSVVIDDKQVCYTFGSNLSGQLGVSTETFPGAGVPPQKLKSLPPIVEVSAGWHHSLFLAEDGSVWGCGKNRFGTLGMGDSSAISPLTKLAPLPVIGVPQKPVKSARKL